MQSLNVSVAAAVVLYHAITTRDRQVASQTIFIYQPATQIHHNLYVGPCLFLMLIRLSPLLPLSPP